MTANNNEVSMSPKFAAAIFFAIFNFLLLLFTKYALMSLKDGALVPLLPASIIAIIIGILLGILFGQSLANQLTGFRAFSLGILIACCALVLLSLVILIYSYLTGSPIIQQIQHWQDYFILFGVILSTLFLTLGIWLIPLTAVASFYFNKRFWPGLAATMQKKQVAKNDTNYHS